MDSLETHPQLTSNGINKKWREKTQKGTQGRKEITDLS